jgi:hypothetical protein
MSKQINKPSSYPIITQIDTLDDPLFWMGYKFTMSDKTKNITCKIDNSAKCCEKWGAYTKSKLSEFIGAEYRGMNVSKIKKDEYDFMRIIDVTIQTNRGDIVIHVYNEHNGFYSHDVFIEWDTGKRTIAL